MQLEEYFNYRNELLSDAQDDDGFISENSVLMEILPLMLEAKLVDSEDFNESPFQYAEEKLKINGYQVNESGERLQVFIVNEDSLKLNAEHEELQIAQKAYYESHFNRCFKFLNKAVKGHLSDFPQDSDAIQALISKISSTDGLDQFDVIEIFLISSTVTIQSRGESPQPRTLQFDNEKIKVAFQKGREKINKEILVLKRLIDLNFLVNVVVSQGNRQSLVIDFERNLGGPLEAIKAADEDHFESYLCVLPATIISELYKLHSTRLLEKNVRSFLQFRGVNKGIRETIREYPEKFIAFNNGLTITSVGKELTERNGRVYIKSLTDFQIVNGGQTTAGIYFTHKDGYDISKVKVMAKINIAKNVSEEQMDDLVSRISKFSNSQSKVSNVDLRSRSPQLLKLKSLSESVVTPSGLKWFFEKSKGEFNTILRKAGKNKTRIEREFPKLRRYTKEELGKYYTAWGEQPYMVKKGGEKVFRYFIEEISGEIKGKKKVEIDRFFYEELISKIILFRSLEKIYGQGKNAKGQLRSAVVPYSLSVLYKFTTGGKEDLYFDLFKVWSQEQLSDDLTAFFDDLMTVINDVIKKYSESDDYGEYSKRPELWSKIAGCKEITAFMNLKNSKTVFSKYTIRKNEYVKRQEKFKQSKDLNFDFLVRSSEIFANNIEYYKRLRDSMSNQLSKSDDFKLEKIIESIKTKTDLSQSHIDFEDKLIRQIRSENPELFDELTPATNVEYVRGCNYVVKEYNYAVANGIKIHTHFSGLRTKYEAKGIKYTSVFDTIAKGLEKGTLPAIKEISQLGAIIV